MKWFYEILAAIGLGAIVVALASDHHNDEQPDSN